MRLDVHFFDSAEKALEEIAKHTFGKREKVYTVEFYPNFDIGDITQVKPLRRR